MTPEDILSITRRGYRVNYSSDSAHIDFAKEVIKEYDKEIQKRVQDGEAIMEKQNANTMFRVGKWWGERPWRK